MDRYKLRDLYWRILMQIAALDNGFSVKTVFESRLAVSVMKNFKKAGSLDARNCFIAYLWRSDVVIIILMV